MIFSSVCMALNLYWKDEPFPEMKGFFSLSLSLFLIVTLHSGSVSVFLSSNAIKNKKLKILMCGIVSKIMGISQCHF